MSLLTRKGKEIRKTQIFFAWSSFILGEVLQFWAYIKTGRILLIEDFYGGWWLGMIITALLGFAAVPVVLGLTRVFEEETPIMARIIFYLFNFGIFFAPYATSFITLVAFWLFVLYLDDSELKSNDKNGAYYFAHLVALVLGNILMHWYYARTKCDPIVTPFINALGMDVRLTKWLWVSTACVLVNFFCIVILGEDGDFSEKEAAWYHIFTILITLLLPGFGQFLLLVANIVILSSKNSLEREKIVVGTMVLVALILLIMWLIGMVHLAKTEGWQSLPLVEYLLELWKAYKGA